MKNGWIGIALAAALVAAAPARSQVFWAEDFSGGALSAGWQNQDDSGNGVLWEVCVGCSQDELLPFALRPFAASTVSNGFAVVNSNASGNLPGSGHLSRLTTPPIDCSEQAQVFLQFQTAIGTSRFNAAQNAQLRVITPEGQQVFSLFPMLSRNNQQQFAPVKRLAGEQAYFITLDISAPAAGRDSVRLQWEWRGNREFAWCIDDILLSSQNPAQPPGTVWFESFSAGAEGWLSNPLSVPDSTWRWAVGGDLSNTIASVVFGDKIFIHSQTGNDGALAFNADFYSTQGTSTQGPFPDYICEAISPPIDLSGVEKPVAVQFSQLTWLGATADEAPQSAEGARFITSLAYSTDGGQSWSEPISANPYQTPVTSYNVFLMPPANNQAYFALPGAEGSSELRLKFTWAGNLYFWALDDIAIVERPDQDMKVSQEYFAVAPNAITPRSQVQDIPLLADVLNHGGQAAEDVQLEAWALRADEGAIVHQDVLLLGDIAVDSLVENELFATMLPAGSLQAPGDYRGYYVVSHAQPDERPQDDSLRWRFVISDTTFAKELGPTLDIAPGTTLRYAFGNCFYVPHGQGWYARHLSFGVANPLRLANAGASVEVALYRWQGDLNGDGKANPQEYAKIGVNVYAFQGFEGTNLITVPVSFEEIGIPLEDDAYYLAVVSYDGPSEPCYMLACDTIDYQATLFAHEQIGRPQYASVLDENLTGHFSLLGFGYNIVPVVRLHIGLSPVLSVLPPALSRQAALKLSPNPASSQVSIELPPELRLAQQVDLEIKDMSGSIVSAKKLGPLPEKALTFDICHLPSGWYSVNLRGSSGTAGAALLLIQR
jgi:hypothetical protein